MNWQLCTNICARHASTLVVLFS